MAQHAVLASTGRALHLLGVAISHSFYCMTESRLQLQQKLLLGEHLLQHFFKDSTMCPSFYCGAALSWSKALLQWLGIPSILLLTLHCLCWVCCSVVAPTGAFLQGPCSCSIPPVAQYAITAFTGAALHVIGTALSHGSYRGALLGPSTVDDPPSLAH